MADRPLDLIVRNVRVVRPHRPGVERLDLGVKDGRFARIAPEIPAADALEVYDAGGRLGFPGVVDAHTHVGIYAPLADDAVTESRAAVSGGVTTMLTYFRTGQYYLNRGGPYAEFFPEVLRLSEGRYHCDYAYHLAPIARGHVDEMEQLATRHGVPSFKIFMFYGGYGLHGQAGQDEQRRFLLVGPDETYDLAQFEFILRAAGRIQRAHPALAPYVSVSLHCEVADILNAYTRLVAQDRALGGLRAYSAARPPHSEGLAVWIAAYLANEAHCVNVNLLHLSSRKALEAALTMAGVFPHIDFKREITVGHLLLDVDTEAASYAKVNPPIRPREDVEYLWRAVLDGKVDWIVSDHACCSQEVKGAGRGGHGDIWLCRPGTARPRAAFHRPGGRLPVEPGLHVRGPGADRSGDRDVPPRSAGVGERRDGRCSARPLHCAADQRPLSLPSLRKPAGGTVLETARRTPGSSTRRPPSPPGAPREWWDDDAPCREARRH
jgi:allantoinase